MLNTKVAILLKKSDNNYDLNYFQLEEFEINESFCLYKALNELNVKFAMN